MVVAVFETNALSTPALSMIPPTIRRGPVPTSMMISRAMRLCASQRWSPIPSISPPMNRKINLCAYRAVVSSTGRIPSTGNRMIGSSAVAAIGTASKIHQTAIKAATPARRRPGSASSCAS